MGLHLSHPSSPAAPSLRLEKWAWVGLTSTLAEEKGHRKHQPAAEGHRSNTSRTDTGETAGPWQLTLLMPPAPLSGQSRLDKNEKCGHVLLGCITHTIPPWAHGSLYNHLQLSVASRNTLVCLLTAVWISVRGWWTLLYNGASEKWVIDMLFFTFFLASVPILEVPYSTCTLQATSGSWVLKYFKTQGFHSLGASEWSPGDFSTSNGMSSHDLETHWDPAIFESLLRSQAPQAASPVSAPWQRPGLNMILIATNSLGCGTAANGSSFYRQVSTVV